MEVSDGDDDDDDGNENEETKANEQPVENVPEEQPVPDLPEPAAEATANAASSSSSDDEDELSAYPDTQVTYSEDLPAKVTDSNPRKTSAGKPPPKVVPKSNNENQPLKRGQRARMKKMKEKYKDQDEEDRLVRMQLLGSAGNEAKKKQQQEQQAKKQNKANSNANNRKKPQPPPSSRPQSAATASAMVDEDEIEQQEDEEEKAKRLSEEALLLATLTGQPMPEDPLINVIGVCAPWVALNNYKYKVKILPGGLGKKGKSKQIESGYFSSNNFFSWNIDVQAALKLFGMDRTATQLEKDLIKTVKDQEVTRNLPTGKVKFVLPSYLKLK